MVVCDGRNALPLPGAPVAERERHLAMTAAYGFGLFELPTYREATFGNWRLIRHLGSFAEGYLSRAVYEPHRHVLYHGRTPWMSTGLMERESHAIHVHRASGVVVAAGLGLGLFAFAASLKREVERVVVVEREAEVVELVKRAAALHQWPGQTKIEIIVADAFDADLPGLVAVAAGGSPVDYLYADIWTSFPAPTAAADTATMVRALQPRKAGWWGQELSFGLWCRERTRRPDQAAMAAYCNETEVPVAVDAGYAQFCADIIAARLGDPTRRPWRARLRDLVPRWT